MKTGAILQTRISSIRLKNKSLLLIKDKTLTDWIILRLLRIKNVDTVIVAIADEPGIEPLIEISKNRNVNWFVGPLDDVLARYYYAARKFKLDVILRATGDNPLIDIVTAEMVIDKLIREKCDYVNIEGLPVGGGVEGFTFSALENNFKQATNVYEHEHVTPYFYLNPDKFKLGKVISPYGDYSFLRLTVDEENDYKLINHLYEKLLKENKDFLPIERVFAYYKQNPEPFDWNKNVKQKILGE
ncbi:MAG: glycosyltransferase family protein [Candidatus Hydrogenedentota bacterium]